MFPCVRMLEVADDVVVELVPVEEDVLEASETGGTKGPLFILKTPTPVLQSQIPLSTSLLQQKL